MLTITIPEYEYFNEETKRFGRIDGVTIELEHSLVSISKWEAKWRKPFLTSEQKTVEETLDYISCMTLTKNVNPEIYKHIPKDVHLRISDYINDPMTATTIRKTSAAVSREVVTAEIIYYWMVALNIPFECENWHLNRLIMLVRVCSEKNQPPKQMTTNEVMAQQRTLNKARLKKFNTRG